MQVGLRLLEQDDLPGSLPLRVSLVEVLDEDRDVQDIIEAQAVGRRVKTLHRVVGEQDTQRANDRLKRRFGNAERNVHRKSGTGDLFEGLVNCLRDLLDRLRLRNLFVGLAQNI